MGSTVEQELMFQVRELRRELAEIRGLIQQERPQLLKDVEVARMLGIGRSTVWSRLKEGRLPQPVRLGTETRWRLADIQRLAA